MERNGKAEKMTNARTAPVKFTSATVREVAERVARLTDGLFRLEAVGSHADRGTYYSDGHKTLTWYGPEGARYACAYYIGGALGFAQANDREIPHADAEYLMQVQAACAEGSQNRKAEVSNWEEQGRERARLSVEAGR